ncbi:sel1 repeat family protein [bacterium]|nr:sel1 repeat family protein [bacterium]
MKAILLEAETEVTAAQVEAGNLLFECGELGEAARWFSLAAHNGDTYSQARLASIYNRGEGVQTCYEIAAEWWKRAAEGGDPRSQYNLGLWLSKGKGLAKNDEQAAYWLSKAAEQGHQKARTLLHSIQERHGHLLKACPGAEE